MKHLGGGEALDLGRGECAGWAVAPSRAVVVRAATWALLKPAMPAVDSAARWVEVNTATAAVLRAAAWAKVSPGAAAVLGR